MEEKIINTDGLKTAAENELEQVAGGKKSPYLPHECHICGAVFRSDKDLQRHIKAQHPNYPRPY